MMRRKLYIVLILCLVLSPALAQKYFVSFSDKNNNTYSINAPNDFLSQRAIDRRTKQSIAITEHDLPVTQTYVDSVKKLDINLLWASKWLNGIILESSNQELMDTLSRVSFIDEVKLIWVDPALPGLQKFNEPTESIVSHSLKYTSIYGTAWDQTATLRGHNLHNNNFEGEGMVIAVLDAGFNNADILSGFSHLWNNNQILSTRDVVDANSDFYAQHDHGSMVLSTMGSMIEGEFKGTAPKAAYHLIRTEDAASEYPIEEYNWVIGAEYADSIGADIINSSLGYYFFEGDFDDYTNEDMDGQTTIVVQGAEAAFSKGMVVVNSAGNEGNNSWGKIISPADGENVLSVAAMQADSIRASFSSYGYSADGRVKPDVTAMGQSVALQLTNGDLGYSNGTSFSGPIIAGFTACLWQAFPDLTNAEIIALVKSNSHQFNNPDNSFGYGIPNFQKALGIDNSVGSVNSSTFSIYPNPFKDNINLSSTDQNQLVERVSIFDLTGKSVFQQDNIYLPTTVEGLSHLPKGIYLIKIRGQLGISTQRIVKK